MFIRSALMRITTLANRFASVTIALLLVLMTGCQTAALAPYRDSGAFYFRTVQSKPFRHLLVLNASAIQATGSENGQILNIYIEGDGQPWHTPSEVAWDPTPKHSTMMTLMAMDHGPALFLGRPCYFGVSDTECSAIWWTHKRYAREILDSMNGALNALADRYAGLRLIGHSGGGTLAMLMAATRDDVESLVTLAGNLDTLAWTRLHEYSPLEGSLNPVDLPVPERVQQLHLVGRMDSVMPPDLIPSALLKQKNVVVRLMDGQDHRCCWHQIWPGILKEWDSRRVGRWQE